MSTSQLASRSSAPAAFLAAPRWPALTRPGIAAIARRLAHFWIVWSALLFIHEGGHAASARRQGLVVRRVTVGMGPVLWRQQLDGTQLVLRLVPVAGMTTLAGPREAAAAVVGRSDATRWRAWLQQCITLGGGVLATVAFALGMAALVTGRERATRTPWLWGRYVVADAVVLTVFNFLPVPPLDGGRAVLGALTAWSGAPLTGDALFWVHAGGMALAVVPMLLWTRWTAGIDAAAMRWGMPAPRRDPHLREVPGA